jgi:hypothetical protein
MLWTGHVLGFVETRPNMGCVVRMLGWPLDSLGLSWAGH